MKWLAKVYSISTLICGGLAWWFGTYGARSTGKSAIYDLGVVIAYAVVAMTGGVIITLLAVTAKFLGARHDH